MKGIRQLFHLGKLDDKLDWEIAHHLNERIDELVAQGLTPDQARREAERAFGDVREFRAQMRTHSRAHARRKRWRDRLDGWRWDLRIGVRNLRRQPGLTAVALLVLGLGIGANTAIFSALRAALLDRPPYPEVDRLVLVDLLMTGAGEQVADSTAWSYPKFELLQRQMRSIGPLAGYATASATLTGVGTAERVTLEYVSPTYFDLLGVRAALGQTFDAGQVPPAPGSVVLLSHDYWTTRMGGDHQVVGRSLRLDGAVLQVAGVLPAGFHGLSGSADVWVPLAGVATVRGPRRLQGQWVHWLQVMGRLQPGVSLEQARQESRVIGLSLDEVYPAPSGGVRQGIAVVPFDNARVNVVARLAIVVVSLSAFLLLLISTGNVAGLLLARAAARRTGLAIRAALGAGRARLIRESLIESMMLAVGGGVLGLLLAYAGQRIVVAAVQYALETAGTRGLQFLSPTDMSVNGDVLLMGLGLAVLTGLLCGILPARLAGRTDVVRDLRAGVRSTFRPPVTTTSGRNVLVTAQLALTIVLLAGALLMAASFKHLSSVAIGYEHDDVLTLGFNRGTDTSPEQDQVFTEELLQRMRALPGVKSVAVAPCAPLTAPCEITGLKAVDGAPVAVSGQTVGLLTYPVSDDYFNTLGIGLERGRSFDVQDAARGAPVAILNETAARLLFPNGSALGRRLAVTHSLTAEQMATVIGVVADVQYGKLETPVLPALYFTARQAPSSYGTLFLRTDGDPHTVLPAVRASIAALAADLPLYDITTMKTRRTMATARTRVVLGLLATFAVAALLLSSIGLYGLVSFSVVQRKREMGLRMALGGTASHIVRLVLATPVLLAILGAAAGLAAAVWLGRYLNDLLFQVTPTDLRLLGLAVLVLCVVALLAALVPAHRATRLEPATSLRAE